MQKPAFDPNTPPGEEVSRRNNLKTFAFATLMLCLGLGFTFLGIYREVVDSRRAELAVSVTAPDQDKFQLLRLGGVYGNGYQDLVVKLDSIGFRISTYDEFMAWNKNISPEKRREFFGEIMTLVPSKDSAFYLSYNCNSSLGQLAD